MNSEQNPQTVVEPAGSPRPTDVAADAPPPVADTPATPAATDVADAATVEQAAPEPPAAADDPEAKNGEAAEAKDTEAKDAKAKGAEGKKSRPRFRDPSIARAFRSRRPVKGKIVGLTKGGYEVRVGRSRAFCPHSQIELFRVDDAESLIGQSYTFRVTQFRRGGEDIVISRRVLLEEEQAEEASALRAALLEGAVITGRVAGTAEFGAFVDLGAGVMGLVHISELSHSRVTRVQDAVKVGDAIRVKILKLHASGKISLSARQAAEDPWARVAESYRVGSCYPGTVQRLTDFGAFVALAPGVEALAPAREFPPRAGGWSEGLEPGTEGSWLVLGIDPGRRRMSLTPAPDDPSLVGFDVEAGATLQGKVQKVERFGVFVWLAPGKVGLLPNVWSGEPRGADMEKKFPVASTVEVEVVEVSEDGQRIRLARPGAYKPEPAPRPAAAKPRAPRAPRGEAPRPEASATPFGNNLGDLLRAALDRREG